MVSKKASYYPQYPKTWSGSVSTADNHFGFHSCKPRRGNWDNSGHSFTKKTQKNKQKKKQTSTVYVLYMHIHVYIFKRSCHWDRVILDSRCTGMFVFCFLHTFLIPYKHIYHFPWASSVRTASESLCYFISSLSHCWTSRCQRQHFKWSKELLNTVHQHNLAAKPSFAPNISHTQNLLLAPGCWNVLQYKTHCFLPVLLYC